MIKKSLITLAACGFAVTAHAQSADTGNGMAGDLKNAIFATTLKEANLLRVNVTDVNAQVWGDTIFIDKIDVETNDVGELTDVVIGTDGQLKGYIAEVGGFMDLGDREVFLSTDQVRIVRVGEDSVNAYTNLTEEELSKLEDVVGMFDK